MNIPEKKSVVLKKLFLSTLYLSAFTFGGGYVIITLLKDKFVNQYGWIQEDEILDLVAIAQSSPGAIAVNGAIVIGYKLAGVPGVLISVLGAIIPPMVILSSISLIYDAFITNPYVSALLSGMTAGVGAVITSVVFDMAVKIVKGKEYVQIFIMILSFILCYFLKINVIYIILCTALFGALRTVATERRNRRS
ncbi:MAG: chromate transporter [Eubacteriales bacterium]|nr:chromate transporter [Eubacteriales bacterium]